MGPDHPKHDSGQFLLGLHIDRIAWRSISRSDWGTSCVWPQHAVGQCIDHVHTGCIVHRLQSSCRYSCTAWIDVGYVSHSIDIDRCELQHFLLFLSPPFAGASWPAIHPMTAVWIPPVDRSKFMANMMASSLGAAITMPICGFLIEYVNWQSVFYVTG